MEVQEWQPALRDLAKLPSSAVLLRGMLPARSAAPSCFWMTTANKLAVYFLPGSSALGTPGLPAPRVLVAAAVGGGAGRGVRASGSRPACCSCMRCKLRAHLHHMLSILSSQTSNCASPSFLARCEVHSAFRAAACIPPLPLRRAHPSFLALPGLEQPAHHVPISSCKLYAQLFARKPCRSAARRPGVPLAPGWPFDRAGITSPLARRHSRFSADVQ
mgnify:CR=1 FL=1